MTALILVLCEVIPKAVAASHPVGVSHTVALPLYIFHQLLRPVHSIFDRVVEPAVRRRGLGCALVEWLEKLARVGGILRVELEVRADDPGAGAFYHRLGYREIGRLPGYYQGRLDAVRLARVRHPVLIK